MSDPADFVSDSFCFVDTFCRGLRNGPRGFIIPNAVGVFASCYATAGYVSTIDLRCLVETVGYSEIAYRHHQLFSALDVKPLELYKRPKVRAKMCDGISFVRIEDAAAMLIRLEQFGITIDPEPLVNIVLSRIANKPYFTGSELKCWLFKKERHRSSPISIRTDKSDKLQAWLDLKTATGYKIYACMNANGKVFQITAYAPKHKGSRFLTWGVLTQ